MKNRKILHIYLFVVTIFMLFENCTVDHKKEIYLTNNKFNEKIYFCEIVIGGDNVKKYISLEQDYSENNLEFMYISYNSSDFFYKLENDTLYVYGGDFKIPKTNNFKTPIKIEEIGNVEYIKYYKNEYYKEIGLSIFPNDSINY